MDFEKNKKVWVLKIKKLNYNLREDFIYLEIIFSNIILFIFFLFFIDSSDFNQ